MKETMYLITEDGVTKLNLDNAQSQNAALGVVTTALVAIGAITAVKAGYKIYNKLVYRKYYK